MARAKGEGAGRRFGVRTVGAILAWAGDSQLRRGLLLAVIALAICLPGLTAMPPTDRDEARFAQASKQMVETGDLIDIRFQEAPRHKKPVGIYWLQSAAVTAFGGADAPIWVYRLPSLFGAVVASLLTAWAVRPLVGARAAFLAGAMTAGLLLVNVEARIAKTDAMLLAAVVLAQGALARLWLGVKDGPRERGWSVFYLWTALGIGVLLKGPIIFLPVLGALLWMTLFQRRAGGGAAAAWGRLGWSFGLVWLLLLAAPWFIAIGVKTEGAFFAEALVKDMAGKVAAGQEAHGAPPGAYLFAFWGTFWPWTGVALLALPWVWRWRRAPETAFLLGWIVPTWIVFELVSTKLPHYVLPTYPAICALVAAAILDGGAKISGWLFRIGTVLWAIPAVALPAAMIVGPIWLERTVVWPAVGLALGALLMFFLAWRWLATGVWLGFFRASLIGAGLTYAAAFHFALPSLSTIWISDRLHAMSTPHRACLGGAAAPLASVGYHEPSLVFAAGTDVALLRARELADWWRANPTGVAWVASHRAERVEEALAAADLTPRQLDETSGFNYNRGKQRDFTLYALADRPVACGDTQ